MGMRVPSGNSGVQGGAQVWQQRQQNFKALSQSLSTGNLDEAKAAYANLTKNRPAQSASDPNSPLAQLGRALQGGDLGAAQQAFAQIKSGHGHQQPISVSTTTTNVPSSSVGNHVNVYV